MEDIKMPSTGKMVGCGFLILIGLLIFGIIGSATNLITIPWLKFNKQVQTNRDIISKTYTADNALYNYHWFKERQTALVALETKIANAKIALSDFETSAGNRKDWTFEDKTEDSQLRTIYLGLKSQYEDLGAEYNARSQEADRNIFSQDLPLFFSIKPF